MLISSITLLRKGNLVTRPSESETEVERSTKKVFSLEREIY